MFDPRKDKTLYILADGNTDYYLRRVAEMCIEGLSLDDVQLKESLQNIYKLLVLTEFHATIQNETEEPQGS